MSAGIETTQASDAPERNGVYLLSYPRTASNLFQTMMEKQSAYQISSYKLFDAGFQTFGKLEKGCWSEWDEEDRKFVNNTFRKCFEDLQDEIADAKKKGKQVFIKEHCSFLHSPEQLAATVHGEEGHPLHVQLRDGPESAYTNPTSLPDRFLLSMQPIFLIRHPALCFASMHRASNDMKRNKVGNMENMNVHSPRTRMNMNVKYSRAVYDWYHKNADSKMQPRVLDADDLMTDPAVVRQICIETGLDPEAVQYTWEQKQVDDPVMKRMLSTIAASKGIVKGLDGRNLDIEAEKAKWKAEFGEEDANVLAERVEEAMPDYKYLFARRTRSK